MIHAMALLAVAFLCIVGPMDYSDALNAEAEEKVARVHRVLLETSSEAATLDECQRTLPKRPRPDSVVSFQNGSATSWHHRTCTYVLRGTKQ